MTFSFGTDPEFMLEKDGKIYSAIGMLAGDKDRKTKLKEFEFYYDNVLAECTIPPTYTNTDAVNTIKNCIKTLHQIVKPMKPIIKASHHYDKSELWHKDAFKVYCVEENCCYTMREIQQDEEIFNKTNLRSAGGHIHIGHPELKKKWNGWIAARLMDLFLGIPSVFLDDDPTSKNRKKIYGQAGRFRFTSYGIEYRSLSNFWLKSPKLVSFVFNASQKVVSLIESGDWKNFWNIDEEKLANTKNWKDKNFDSTKCHSAIYDTDKLRTSINESNKEIASEYTSFLTKDLYEEMKSIENVKFKSLEEEWQ
jgi:hypothetical protein